MTTVEEHYATHLAPVYLWMVGDLAAAFERSRAFVDALGASRGGALDLGCGFGLHAIPLAEQGYRVTAIDSSEHLLNELATRAGSLPITPIRGDLVDVRRLAPEPVSLCVCLGDTLTHLGSAEHVPRLFRDVAGLLDSGGVFALTFRDYAGPPPQGPARFIPVRSDDARILTCFLDYQADCVEVHDILHERTDGGWKLRVSSYRKLRIARDWAATELRRAGLELERDVVDRGMITLVARRA